MWPSDNVSQVLSCFCSEWCPTYLGGKPKPFPWTAGLHPAPPRALPYVSPLLFSPLCLLSRSHTDLLAELPTRQLTSASGALFCPSSRTLLGSPALFSFGSLFRHLLLSEAPCPGELSGWIPRALPTPAALVSWSPWGLSLPFEICIWFIEWMLHAAVILTNVLQTSKPQKECRTLGRPPIKSCGMGGWMKKL